MRLNDLFRMTTMVLSFTALSLNPLARAETSILSILYQASQSVVQIKSETGSKATLHGTGIIIDSSGIIVTNAHVVNQALKIHVMTASGQSYYAQPLQLDTANDLCLLKIRASEPLPHLALANVATVALQSRVYSIGGSALLKNTLSEGKVTGIAFSKTLKQPLAKRKAADIKLFQVNMDLYPGDSGSPIFNRAGEVIGIISAAEQKRGKTTFVIPASLIQAHLLKVASNAE